MTIIPVKQGETAWHAARANSFCASEASAVLGVSKYTTRSALLKQKATGIAEEVTPAKQRLFDAGHASEADAAPIAERIAGLEFYPAVGKAEIEGLPLLASFDGIDMLEEVVWENKLRNASLVDQVRKGQLEPHYWAQLEHQLLVSGAQKALFTTSDGTEAGTEALWYFSEPERRARLIAAWKQFAIDLAAYEPSAPIDPAPTGRAPETLPALYIEVTGMVTASNLEAFKANALAVFAGINRNLKTDADFYDAEKTVKWACDVEDRLAAAKQHALSQTASIDALFRTIDDISAEARRVRLDLDKLVKARKASIRGDIEANAAAALRQHIDALNTRLGRAYMPPALASADFGGAIKGKKSLSSMEDAVSVVLANAKISANEVADRIQANLTHLREKAKDHTHLFADAAQLVHKAPDDLAAVVSSRIAAYVEQERAKEEATRERIRTEEVARLESEAAARRHQEQRDAQAAADAAARAGREEAAQAHQAAQAGIAEGRAAEVLPGPLLDDLSAVATQIHTDSVASIDAQAAINTARRGTPPAPADDGPANLLIGGINERLGYSVNAIFLKHLGFEPARIDGARRFYRDSDLPRIGRAIAEHTLRVTQQTAHA